MNLRLARLPSYYKAPAVTILIIGLNPLIELVCNLVWSHLNFVRSCSLTATLSDVRAEVGITISILTVEHWENHLPQNIFCQLI